MFRRCRPRPGDVLVPQAELEELQEELIRLRLEQHRPLNLAQVGRDARASSDAATSDETWHAVAEAQALRASLLAVLQNLNVACAQLGRQLDTDTPATEIDRRVGSERRLLHAATPRSPRSERERLVLALPDLENEQMAVSS